MVCGTCASSAFSALSPNTGLMVTVGTLRVSSSLLMLLVAGLPAASLALTAIDTTPSASALSALAGSVTLQRLSLSTTPLKLSSPTATVTGVPDASPVATPLSVCDVSTSLRFNNPSPNG